MDENFPIKKPNIRTLALVVATLLYLLTGAVVFDQLESKTEELNKGSYMLLWDIGCRQ